MRFKIVRFAPLSVAKGEGMGEGMGEGQNQGRKRLRGAGDLVAVIAHPIAGILDRVFATHFGADCKGCADRQKWLNKTLPFPLQTPFRERQIRPNSTKMT